MTYMATFEFVSSEGSADARRCLQMYCLRSCFPQADEDYPLLKSWQLFHNEGACDNVEYSIGTEIEITSQSMNLLYTVT